MINSLEMSKNLFIEWSCKFWSGQNQQFYWPVPFGKDAGGSFFISSYLFFIVEIVMEHNECYTPLNFCKEVDVRG